MKAAPTTPTRYIPALDGLRGIAVLAVIVYHVAAFAPEDLEGVSALALYTVRFGWAGVDLFFVLSGFLITGILYDHRNSRQRLRGFYGRRLLRIAPLYYFALLIYALTLYWIGIGHFVGFKMSWQFFDAVPWHFTYLTNVLVSLENSWKAAPLGTLHFWSLAVEEQFYLLWPAVLGLVHRFARSPRIAMMWVCAGLVVLSVTFRLVVLAESPLAAYTMLPARMDALVIGAWIALGFRGPRGEDLAIVWSGRVLTVSMVAILAFAVESAGVRSNQDPIQQSFGYTVWAIGFGALIARVTLIRSGRLWRALKSRPFMNVGRLSYGLYLIHYPVLFWVARAEPPFGVFGIGVLTLGITYALAVASWHAIELPFLRLKHHFPYDPPEPSRSAFPPEARLSESSAQPPAMQLDREHVAA